MWQQTYITYLERYIATIFDCLDVSTMIKIHVPINYAKLLSVL